MPGNIQPIYTRVGSVARDGLLTSSATFSGTILTATGDYTGASANHQLVWTADSVNGGFIQRIRFNALGTNITTVIRIYINNGGTQTTAANNELYGQVSMPATTASNTAATTEVDYPMGFALPPGFRIYAGTATTIASGWVAVGIGGAY